MPPHSGALSGSRVVASGLHRCPQPHIMFAAHLGGHFMPSSHYMPNHRQPRIACHAVQTPSPDLILRPSSPHQTELFKIQSIAAHANDLRSRLRNEHVAGGWVFSAAGGLVKRNGYDVHHRFRPNSNYYWLTGCDEPDTATLMDTETGLTTLLVPKQEPDVAFWIGPQKSWEHVAKHYGVDQVAYTSDLPSILGTGQQVHVTCEEDLPLLAKMMGATADGGGATQWPSETRVLDALLPPIIKRLRSVKTDSEIACLLQANIISGAAHMDTWRACRPGMSEYQLEAVFTHACMMAGLPSMGYPCIVGAGGNAAILHYDTNRCQVGVEDLVLIDAGAEFRCYTADITRTFPASGRFTPQQRDIYNAVLDTQMLALSQLSPGVVLKEVETSARRLLVARLQDLGLMRRGPSIDALMAAGADRLFMPHGLSHFLGLDVHDVSDTGPVPKGGLQQGHVITVEPGCYFIETLLARAATNPELSPLLCWDVIDQFKGVGGVRIEDNVAILSGGETGPGMFNLTQAAGVVKEAAQIEYVMAS